MTNYDILCTFVDCTKALVVLVLLLSRILHKIRFQTYQTGGQLVQLPSDTSPNIKRKLLAIYLRPLPQHS